MNKLNKNLWINKISFSVMLLVCVMSLASCKEDDAPPVISSVWFNMVEQPIEQTTFAYPKQTICLHGEHFGDLSRVIVNGTDISLNSIFMYQADNYITFQLPTDVNTEGDYIRVVTKWGMDDFDFIIRPLSEQPAISSFSSTTLLPGRVLTITGSNLDGASEVWLPLTFDGRVKCELDESQPGDATTVNVIIPDGVDFATGQCEIVMEKTDEVRGLTYTEKVYSDETNFIN